MTKQEIKIEIPTPIMWSTKCRKWYSFCGYDTYTSELIRIFGINRATFLNRVSSGWPLAAALTAEPEGGWSLNNAHILAERPEIKKYCQTLMDQYMKQKKKHVRKTVELNAGSHIGLPSRVQQFADDQGIGAEESK